MVCITTDPVLGALQNNGGRTFTHGLLTGSPAIDAGDPNFTPPPFTDQRAYARVPNGRIDIGSLRCNQLLHHRQHGNYSNRDTYGDSHRNTYTDINADSNANSDTYRVTR